MWAGPKKFSTPSPLHRISVIAQSLTCYLPHPDLEMTGFPDLSVSLAPSSQCIVSRSSDTGVKHHMQTIAIGRLYDQGHHCKSKVSAARVQGAADEMSPGPSIARAGESSLKYAQGLALHRSPWCSRTGGEFGCILAICKCMTFKQPTLHFKRHCRTLCKLEAARPA